MLWQFQPHVLGHECLCVDSQECLWSLHPRSLIISSINSQCARDFAHLFFIAQMVSQEFTGNACLRIVVSSPRFAYSSTIRSMAVGFVANRQSDFWRRQYISSAVGSTNQTTHHRAMVAGHPILISNSKTKFRAVLNLSFHILARHPKFAQSAALTDRRVQFWLVSLRYGFVCSVNLSRCAFANSVKRKYI